MDDESLPYILIIATPYQMQFIPVSTPEIPDSLVDPGSIAFVLKPIAFKALHSHIIPTVEVQGENNG